MPVCMVEVCEHLCKAPRAPIPQAAQIQHRQGQRQEENSPEANGRQRIGRLVTIQMSAFTGKERSAGKKEDQLMRGGGRERQRWCGTQTLLFSPWLCFQSTQHLISSPCVPISFLFLSSHRGTGISMRLARANSSKHGHSAESQEREVKKRPCTSLQNTGECTQADLLGASMFARANSLENSTNSRRDG